MPLGITLGLAVACTLSGAACQRAVAASFVPSLHVQLAARQSREGIAATPRAAPWDATVVAVLRFQANIAARGVPVRAEFEPELAVIPCELEDLACLEEFTESERAASSLQGELE